ncbi:Protein CBG11565 [Caenorhabditis briggsae]|uniref:Protein CBG11565 n=1 Tax=Caenorhabditis briggsae TaxID=6238 RepID=A8XDI2_CAEBR|nr:Protein CBG11565 [Caenorhabditis briggsae]CAP30701.2 Protein CBG11565 [Caenorhabditis briggsae]
MLGVFFPETILGYSIYPPLMESILITTGINLMVFNEFQSIYTAVNRLFAIFFPIKCNLFFGIKATLTFHILYYLDRIRNLTMEHFDRYRESNFMTFSPKYLAHIGSIVSPDGMFYWGLALLIFPFLINVVTFIRFYYMKKRTSRESEHWKKAKKNMILFLQTVFQDALFSLNVFFALKWQ